MKLTKPCLLALLAISSPLAHSQGDPEFPPMPPVQPLSPADEQKTFLLPPGYRMELVLSEPDITEPVAMAPVGRGAVSGRYGWRFQRATEVRPDLPDGPRLRGERDKPDLAAIENITPEAARRAGWPFVSQSPGSRPGLLFMSIAIAGYPTTVAVHRSVLSGRAVPPATEQAR